MGQTLSNLFKQSKWKLVKYNSAQDSAIKKLTDLDQFIIIHVYESGTLLVALTDHGQLNNCSVYFIDTQGTIQQTHHPFTEFNCDYNNYHIFKILNWQKFATTFKQPVAWSNNTGYFYVNEGHADEKMIALPELEPKYICMHRWLCYELLYGGVLRLEEICQHHDEKNSKVVKHFRCIELDEVVRHEILPTDPVFISKSKDVLLKHLVTNVTGIVLGFL